jgi:hypothetical protein
MKRLMVFFIIVITIVFQHVKVDAAIICPYVLGINSSCGTINDRPSTATTISITTNGNKTVYNASFNQSRNYYYQFTAPYSGYYDVYLSSGEQLTNTYILDSSLNIIGSNLKRSTAEFFKVPIIRGNTYYIQVYVPYDTYIPLNITIYGFDTNSIANPHTFNVGSTTASNFEYVGDVDYFKISHITGVVSIYSNNHPDLKMTLIDQNGIILGETDSDTPVIAYYLQGSYEYIVRVELMGYKGFYTINSDFY